MARRGDREQATGRPSPFPDGEVVAALRLALDGLPANQRTAIRLAMIECLTVPEIAAKLGSTPAGVLAAMRGGLFTLREIFDLTDRSVTSKPDALDA